MRHLPLIQPTDFAGFRAILGTKLGADYADWLRRHTDRQHELHVLGERYRAVTLHPYEFKRYCAYCGKSPTLDSLDEFASAKTRAGGAC
jgi:hypothetical protein